MANSERSRQIETLKAELNASSERATALFKNHSSDQLTRRPAGGGWSAAECVEHLALTSRMFLPDLDAVRQKGARESFLSGAPFKMGLVGGLLLKVVGPGSRFKTKATRATPATTVSPESALSDYITSQDELFGRMQGMAAISLDNIKVASPMNSAITYNVYSLLRIIEAHQRRHLEQAEKALGITTPKSYAQPFKD